LSHKSGSDKVRHERGLGKPESVRHVDFRGLKIDAMLLSWLPNVRYVSGFTGSNAMVLMTPDSLTLFTDPRYDIRAREEARSAKVVITRKHLWENALAAIKRKKLKRVGFEQSRVSFEAYKAMDEALPLGYSLKPQGPLIEILRMVKTEEEIAKIRRAVDTNSAAFENVAKAIRLGVTESEIAASLDYEMRKLGAEGTAFETIVASGKRTALPHASPTRQQVEANQLLLIDMGASQDGYMSDMTRMLILGDPGPKIREMYRAVYDAQAAAIAGIREGVTAGQVDRKARDVLKTAGLDKAFVHSTGHGLGLEIHEAPRVGRKDKTRLKAGMVITIEPGAYVEGMGGIRIEDTVLVTKTGCEVLTPTSKELRVL
jgi:Xaa-Pro aminopeptidase